MLAVIIENLTLLFLQPLYISYAPCQMSVIYARAGRAQVLGYLEWGYHIP